MSVLSLNKVRCIYFWYFKNTYLKSGIQAFTLWWSPFAYVLVLLLKCMCINIASSVLTFSWSYEDKVTPVKYHDNIFLFPPFRFTGLGQCSVLYWLEYPMSSSLRAARHARSWWHVWPVRISRLWRQPAWPGRHCPRSHRMPLEPSRPTNKKTTDGNDRNAYISHADQARLQSGPKTRIFN